MTNDLADHLVKHHGWKRRDVEALANSLERCHIADHKALGDSAGHTHRFLQEAADKKKKAKK